MRNKYIVIYISYDDLCYEPFDHYDDAKTFIEKIEDKCVMVKIENLCDKSFDEPNIEVEDFT